MRSLPSFLGLCLFIVISSTVEGQFGCYGDDGFSVPGACCIPVTTVNLPSFPAVTLPAEGCCFLDCSVEAVYPFTLFLGAPVPLFCDVYIIPATFIGGPSIQSAFLVGKYSRTWVEGGAAGTVGRQVWRFLVNTDLTYLPPYSPPCPTPECAALGGLPVHFVGSLDYAQDCVTSGNWSAAINLTHFCGDMAHGYQSQRPTPFSHPERLFAMVAPTPFDWTATGPPPTGFTFGDSARSTQADLTNLTWICQSEVFVTGGQTLGVGMTCPCASSATAQPRWAELDIRFDYGCAAPGNLSFAPIPWPPVVPSGFSLFPLGTYTGPAGSYPAGESVSVGFGVAAAPDPCNLNFPFHFVYGVSTAGGDLGSLYNHPVSSNRFFDLHNSLPFVNTPPYMVVGYGSLFLSTMVWSTNL